MACNSLVVYLSWWYDCQVIWPHRLACNSSVWLLICGFSLKYICGLTFFVILIFIWTGKMDLQVELVLIHKAPFTMGTSMWHRLTFSRPCRLRQSEGSVVQLWMASHLWTLLLQSCLLTGRMWRETTSLIFPASHWQDILGWTPQLSTVHLKDLPKSCFRTMIQWCRLFTWMDFHSMLLGIDLSIAYPFYKNGAANFHGRLTNWFILQCRMDYGVWTEDRRGSYNKWDAIYRCTVQVCRDHS